MSQYNWYELKFLILFNSLWFFAVGWAMQEMPGTPVYNVDGWGVRDEGVTAFETILDRNDISHINI